MKLCILYHPRSEYARKVEEFAHDFKHRNSTDVQLVSLETREGSATASLYDIVRYPAVLALKENGELVKHWEGAELPLMAEVASYAA
jgi:hypothetical protein